MKYLILSLIAVLVSVSSSLAASYVNVTAHYGPVLSSPDFTPFASNTVKSIQSMGKSDRQLKNTLLPIHVTGNPVTNTIWIAVEIFSDQPFRPTNLVVEITSSSTNKFGKYRNFNNPNLGYFATSLGVVWPANGPIRFINQGTRWSSEPVNQFVFLAVAVDNLTTGSQAEFDANVNWLMSFDNFMITNTASMNGIGSGIKILQTRPEKSVGGKFDIIDNPPNATKTLKLPTFVGLGEIWSNTNLNPNNNTWKYYGTFNSGASITVAPNTPEHYWKLLLD